MARNSPVVTLLAGGALGVGLLLAGMGATPAAQEQPEAGAEPAAGATDGPAGESAEPEPELTEQADDAPDAQATDDTADPGDEVGEPAQDDAAGSTQPPDEKSEPETYVGYVDSGAASVAVIVDGDETVAYICDGNTREAWLSGAAAEGVIELTGDGGSLSATFDGSVVEGQTTVDGQTWTFSVAQVDSPDGLYRFADTIDGGAEVVGGWIVLPDGNQVGAVNVDGETQPAEQLDVDTGRVTVDGDVVTAERQG